jgi:CheY-like chemotaxis protein
MKNNTIHALKMPLGDAAAELKLSTTACDGASTVRLAAARNHIESRATPMKKLQLCTEKEKKRILVVDDNENSAKTLGWMLELMFGHEVQVAYDGASAIAIAKSFIPDLVLLDIGMPEMNGYEICQAMRQESSLKNAMIVAQTGWGQKEHHERSKDAGFDNHIVKPVTQGALQEILNSLEQNSVSILHIEERA